MNILVPESQENIYTVSRLTNEVRFILEDTFPAIWIEGEISNFAAPQSGHWYFSLKDAGAQVRCAMFRGNQRKLGFTPKDGMHVLVKARVSMYEARGEFQLIAEFMEERGEGKLQRAFEALKKKLAAAGLFDPEHKKPLPAFPTQIGVITSATGAAIRDILHVLKRRYACLPVIIYPTLVQGESAAPIIVKAIQTANQRDECDVLILARGGGSLEDLWPFNEESVAQAIYQSHIPIISGIGHEVDFTIADFVADYRAPTPSAAAEIVTPDSIELQQTLKRQASQLQKQMLRNIAGKQQQLNWMQTHLQQQHPKRRLQEKMQRLDFCELTLVQLQTRYLHRLQTQISSLNQRLQEHRPSLRIHQLQHQLQLMNQQMQNKLTTQLTQINARLSHAAAQLNALSPLATLQRGYAVATRPDGKIIREATQVASGEEVKIKLSKGILDCIVEKVS